MATIKNDVLTFTNECSCQLHGPIGAALQKSVRNRLMNVNYRNMAVPFFEHSETDNGWRGEFWGKVVRSAILSWRTLPETALLTAIRGAIDDILAAQEPNGAISSYPVTLRLNGWDLWGRKYVLLGLVRYYFTIEQDPRVKLCCSRMLDQLMSTVNRDKRGILWTGCHEGLASSSILGAVIGVWKMTGESKYLDYAKWIVECGCSSKHDIFLAAQQLVPPAEIGNAKAYEMMSCFKGVSEMLAELPPRYGDVLLAFYRMVRDQEIMITGTAGATNCGEYWYQGKRRQTWPDAGKLGETCVTVTWIQFCGRMLALTADSTVADEMERCAYNALLGAMTPDGVHWTHRNPTPLSAPASKIAADDQMLRNFGTPFDGHDCCRAQGPEGLAQIAIYAVMRHPEGIVVNFYEALDAQLTTASGNPVKIHITGDYPYDEKVSVQITPQHTEVFVLRLRIPGWWTGQSQIVINGEPQAAIAGTYWELRRQWSGTCQIDIRIDLAPRFVSAPDDDRLSAVCCGPIVMAQDSRLMGLDRAVPAGEKPEICQLPGFHRVIRFSDGSMMCDYESAGNLFVPDNKIRVWVETSSRQNEVNPQNTERMVLC